MAECRVSPGKTHVLIGDSVFGQIRPELMYPHKAQQKISVSGLTVDDLLHWLQNVPKCRDVQLLVVHVGVNTCWVNTVTESMWRALLKLLKSVFPNAVVQLSSLISPQGEHPLRKTVAASNAALVKACHSEQVMLADHTDTFTTNSGAPRKALYRDALHPSPKGTVRLACNVKYVGQSRPPLRPQERPSHPSPSASGRVPLLETPSFQPRFDCPPNQHLREGGTEMGQLFQPLAVLSHHLHCYNNGLRTRKAPSHNDGWVTPHYTIGLTATAEEHPNTVMSAPLRHPSVAGTEHIDTLSADGPRHRRSPAMELSHHLDVSVHTGPQPTLPSTHSKPASSCTPSHQLLGGGGGVQRRHLCNASLQCVSSSVF